MSQEPEPPAPGAADGSATAPGGPTETVAVRVGPAEFGLPIDRVLEVVRAPSITRIPFPPACVLGVATIRGRILPVVDLGERLLGTPSIRDGRLVVVHDAATDTELGLLVDAVSGLLGGDQTPQEPPPEVEAALPEGWITGVVALEEGRLVTLLHLDPVLDLTDSTEQERR